MQERSIHIHYESEVVDVIEKDDDNGYKGEEVGDVQRGGLLVTVSGAKIPFDECVWCTSAATQPWLRDTGIELDAHGFIAINDDLATINDPKIFACGDVASMINHPRPKAGVFAVRQGPPLALNLRHALLGEPLEPYVPQTSRFANIFWEIICDTQRFQWSYRVVFRKAREQQLTPPFYFSFLSSFFFDLSSFIFHLFSPFPLFSFFYFCWVQDFLGLISTGDQYAIASRGGLLGCCAMEGYWLWKWKDHIDRTWMAGYTTNLPDMSKGAEAKALAAAKGVKVASAAGDDAIQMLSHVSMRCGGCGSKVGAHVLSRVMRRLREGGNIPTRPEVLIGLDAPDDAAVVQGIGVDQVSIHTVDFFRSFIEDPYIFGRIAANHALSDCHAMCADAVTVRLLLH